MQTTSDQVQAYCTQHGLTFAPRKELDRVYGTEEWEGMQCAAFDGHLGLGPAVLYLDDAGDAWVIVEWADGVRFMEDKFTKLLAEEVARALGRGTRLHLK